MTPPTLNYGGLELNDGYTYVLLPGVDFGEPDKTYDEYMSYSGGVGQLNVSSAHLVQVTIPLLVRAVSAAGLYLAVDAINALIDAGPQTLVYEDDGGIPVTYSCVSSPRVNYVRSASSATDFYTNIDLVLWRLPAYSVFIHP